ncbi:MAG: VRR-NUC domain-containing protein [Carnobacterium sp.]|uniref:VRR-NUC domain-containing protein n=1 Tax=Carnobacterium sp. TaxID=48221 RepID=UPI002FC5B992
MASWKSRTNCEPEKQVENHLIDRVNNLGGLAWKFTSPGNAGVPDRIVVLNNLICFVELKRPKGGKISDMQAWRIGQLINQGMKAYVIKNKEQVDELIGYMMKGILPDA